MDGGAQWVKSGGEGVGAWGLEWGEYPTQRWGVTRGEWRPWFGKGGNSRGGVCLGVGREVSSRGLLRPWVRSWKEGERRPWGGPWDVRVGGRRGLLEWRGGEVE